MTTKSPAKKPKKWYYYGIKVPERGSHAGEEIVKTINQNDNPEILEETFQSQITPGERKTKQENYDEWGGGKPSQGGGLGGSYADLIRASQKGGQNSSRRIWKNEAEKQRAKRAKKDWLAGKEIMPEQTDLLIKAGVITKENEAKSKKNY